MVGLAGCSATGMSQSDGGGPDVGAADQPAQVEEGIVEFNPDTGEITGQDGVTRQLSEVRQVIVTGSVAMTVDEPREAADEIAGIVEGAGGHIDSRVESAPRDDDRGRAELTVRIPAERLTETLDEIEALGKVDDTDTRRQDVTAVAKDLDARITALEASVDRLLALMVQATTTSDLITIESALSERQSELESLQAQRRSLADQVDYSTITISLVSEADAPVDEPDTFLSGLSAGWEALVGFVSFLLVAAGVILPWLIVPAIVLLVVWLLVRRRRARQT